MTKLTTPWDGTPDQPGRSPKRLSASGTGATRAKQLPPCKGGSDSKPQIKGAYGEKRGTPRTKDLRPTHDQLYLVERINDIAPKGRLSPAAIQKLNLRYGVGAVSSALRSLRGFPPSDLRSAFAYLDKVCSKTLASEPLS